MTLQQTLTELSPALADQLDFYRGERGTWFEGVYSRQRCIDWLVEKGFAVDMMNNPTARWLSVESIKNPRVVWSFYWKCDPATMVNAESEIHALLLAVLEVVKVGK